MSDHYHYASEVQGAASDSDLAALAGRIDRLEAEFLRLRQDYSDLQSHVARLTDRVNFLGVTSR